MIKSLLILSFLIGFINDAISNNDNLSNSKIKYDLLKIEITKSIETLKHEDSIKWELLKKKYKINEREAVLIKNELLNQELKFKNEKLNQDMIVRWTYIISMCIGFIILIFIIHSTLKLNKLKYEANQLLEKKTNYIEKQKSELVSNITYAKKIQELYITGNDNAYNDDEYFVINMPRDIVGGDFYWFLRLENNNRLFVVADCTGHGVPGGFLSVISHAIIKDIIESGIREPSTILKKLHLDIINRLFAHEDKVKLTDGLDIIVGIQDTKNSIVSFASAKMPPVFISDKKLNVIKPDMISIGYSSLNREVEKNIEVRSLNYKYKTGEMLYLFSDGFSDQFDHENKKQILDKGLYSLLTEVSELGLVDQKNRLLNYFDNWKGNNKQTDDVLVAGIRLN